MRSAILKVIKTLFFKVIFFQCNHYSKETWGYEKFCISKAPGCLRGREKGRRLEKRKRGFSAAVLSQEEGSHQNIKLYFLHFLLLSLLLLKGFSTALV